LVVGVFEVVFAEVDGSFAGEVAPVADGWFVAVGVLAGAEAVVVELGWW